jgi:flagellar biosynthesis component FlhA
VPLTTPVAIEIGANLIPWVATDDNQLTPALEKAVESMRKRVQDDLGVRLPGVRFRGVESDMLPDTYVVKLWEVPRIEGTVARDERGPEELWQPVDIIVRHCERLLRADLSEFVGHQEVLFMLGEAGMNDEAARLKSRPHELARLVTVLRSLLLEGVSIGPLAAIVGEWRRQLEAGSNLQTTVEAIRSLPVVCDALPGNEPGCAMHRLTPAVEARLRASLSHEREPTLALEPEWCQRFVAAVRRAVAGDRPSALLVTDPVVRPHVKEVLRIEWPQLPILSLSELAADIEAASIPAVEMENA